jgi:Sec-independent protein translocase protein TatA
LGKGIREFKGSVREIERELKVPDEKLHRPPPPPPVGEENREPRKLTTGDEVGQAKDTKA